MEHAVKLQPIIDDMGMEINHIYDEGKHSITLHLMMEFCTLMFGEFLKGFFDFEKLGKSTRTMFEELLAPGKGNKDTQAEETERELNELLTAILKDKVPKNTRGRELAESKVAGFLIAKKIPATTAGALAKKIVADFIKQTKL